MIISKLDECAVPAGERVKLKNRYTDLLSVTATFSAHVIFGFSFIFSKRALDLTTPFVLLGIRFIVAFFILNIIIAVKKIRLDFKKPLFGTLILLGLFEPVIYFVAENYAVTLISTSIIGTILAVVPVISVTLGFFILGERVTPFQIIWAALSVLGIFITTLGQQANGFNWLGIVLSLVAVCSAAMYGVLSRKISVQYSPIERTYIMFLLGSITFSVLGLIQCKNDSSLLLIPLRSADFWVSVLFLGGMSSVAAYLLINYAVTHISVARTSIFANITTVISIFAGVLILKEPFGLYQVIGSAIVILSAYFVNRPAGQKKIEPAAELPEQDCTVYTKD